MIQFVLFKQIFFCHHFRHELTPFCHPLPFPSLSIYMWGMVGFSPQVKPCEYLKSMLKLTNATSSLYIAVSCVDMLSRGGYQKAQFETLRIKLDRLWFKNCFTVWSKTRSHEIQPHVLYCTVQSDAVQPSQSHASSGIRNNWWANRSHSSKSYLHSFSDLSEKTPSAQITLSPLLTVALQASHTDLGLTSTH